jgi:signal transduction histidine kinase
VRVAATAEADAVLITVADGCGGIPETDLARVFDLAWRATAARTPDADGSAGLGLTIVRGIVEAHSGHVRVVNAGKGCSFEVRLPASAQDDSGDPAEDRSAGQQPVSRPDRLLYL